MINSAQEAIMGLAGKMWDINMWAYCTSRKERHFGFLSIKSLKSAHFLLTLLNTWKNTLIRNFVSIMVIAYFVVLFVCCILSALNFLFLFPWLFTVDVQNTSLSPAISMTALTVAISHRKPASSGNLFSAFLLWFILFYPPPKKRSGGSMQWPPAFKQGLHILKIFLDTRQGLCLEIFAVLQRILIALHFPCSHNPLNNGVGINSTLESESVSSKNGPFDFLLIHWYSA